MVVFAITGKLGPPMGSVSLRFARVCLALARRSKGRHWGKPHGLRFTHWTLDQKAEHGPPIDPMQPRRSTPAGHTTSPLCTMSHHCPTGGFPFPLFVQNSPTSTSAAAQEVFPAKFPADR